MLRSLALRVLFDRTYFDVVMNFRRSKLKNLYTFQNYQKKSPQKIGGKNDIFYFWFFKC